MEAVTKSKRNQSSGSTKTYRNVNTLMVGTNHLHLKVGNNGDEEEDGSPDDKKMPKNQEVLTVANLLSQSLGDAPPAEETGVKQAEEIKGDPETSHSASIQKDNSLADSQHLHSVSQGLEGRQINNATSSQMCSQRVCDSTDPNSEGKEKTTDCLMHKDEDEEVQDPEAENEGAHSLNLTHDSCLVRMNLCPEAKLITTEDARHREVSGQTDFQQSHVDDFQGCESTFRGIQTHMDNAAAECMQQGLIHDANIPHSLSRDSSSMTVQYQRNKFCPDTTDKKVIPSEDSAMDFQTSDPQELGDNKTRAETAGINYPQMTESETLPKTSSKGKTPSLISTSSSIDEGFKSSSLFDEDEYCIIDHEDVVLESEGESGHFEISEHPGSDIHMIGVNTLDVHIGDRVIRSHSLEENTHVRMRYRKIKPRKKLVDGVKQNDRLEIVIQIDQYPEAELAAVEQLNQDDTLCSRITAALSNLGSSVMRFRFGSVVIELRPDSKDSVQQINRAIDDGTFDDIILDILKQKPVFQLIKGKDVTIDIDFNVPEDSLLEEDSSRGLKTDVKDKSGKPMFGVCVRVEDEGRVLGKAISLVTDKHQHKCVNDIEEVIRLLKDLVLQIEKEAKMKKELVVQLRKLAEELDIKLRKMSKAKIALASGGIVGSIMTIAGIALAPVTFGASLGLTIAGVGIGVSSGVGGIGTTIADKIINKKTLSETQARLNKYQAVVNNLLNLLQELKAINNADMHRLMSEELTDVDATTLLNLKRIFAEPKSGHGDEGQSNFSTTDPLTSAAEIGANLATVAGRTMVTTFETGLRAVRIGGIVVAVLTVPLDVYTLITNSIKIHKNTPFQTSEEIRKLADRIEKYNPLELSSEAEIMSGTSTEIVKSTTLKSKRNVSDKAYTLPVEILEDK